MSSTPPYLLVFAGIVTIASVLVVNITTAQNACHSASQTSGGNGSTGSTTANQAKLDEIDVKLNEMYNKITKDAEFEQDCNYSVEIGGFEQPLIEIFERFELQRAFYEAGLWGYCAEQGAADLISKITELTAIATANHITICDRNKILYCHENFKKCQCIRYNKNFRNIAADWWDDSEKDKAHKLNESRCFLLTGSDCPFLPPDYYKCVPGSECRFKDSKKPCRNHQRGMELPIKPTGNYTYRHSNYNDSNVYCQCFLKSNVEGIHLRGNLRHYLLTLLFSVWSGHGLPQMLEI